MTVRINWLDHLIGSNWIRKANPERPTVGPCAAHRGPCATHRWPCAAHHGPWAARQGLPTVGRLGNLAQNVCIFIARGCLTTREIRVSIFFESCWVYWSHYKSAWDLQENQPHIIDIGKGIFKLNISVTTAKYFQTSDIICFCKSLIAFILPL